MPKAELHLHLEGSVEPETLHELDPSTPLEEFRASIPTPISTPFCKAFGAVGKRLRTPEDYALITRRLLERLAAQNVRYAEIILAAGRGAVEGAGVRADLRRRSARPPRSPACEVRWILDAVRQFGVEPRDAGGRTGGRARGPGRGRLRHRRQRRARPGRMVQRRLRVRPARRPAPDRPRRREHGAGIRLGRARTGRRTHRPRHRRGATIRR